MVILCLNHNYFPVSEWDYFLIHLPTRENMVGLRKKKIKTTFSIYISWRNFLDLKPRMKFTAKYRFTNSHCLMLCERSCILRVQLQQLSGWIFSSVTFDSSPMNRQSSSPDGESSFIVGSHQLLLRGGTPQHSLAAHGALPSQPAEGQPWQDLQLPPGCCPGRMSSSTLDTPASLRGTARKTEKYHFVSKVQVHCLILKGGVCWLRITLWKCAPKEETAVSLSI